MPELDPLSDADLDRAERHARTLCNDLSSTAEVLARGVPEDQGALSAERRQPEPDGAVEWYLWMGCDRVGTVDGMVEGVEDPSLSDAIVESGMLLARLVAEVRRLRGTNSEDVCFRWDASWTACGRGAFGVEGSTTARDRVSCPRCRDRLSLKDELAATAAAADSLAKTLEPER